MKTEINNQNRWKSYLNLILLSCIISFLNGISTYAQDFQWFRGASTADYNFYNSAIDNTGNTYLLGQYQSSLTLDTLKKYAPGGGDSYCVARVNSAGEGAYIKNITIEDISFDYDFQNQMIAGDNGDVYVSFSQHSFTIDNDTIIADTTNAKILFAKFDSNFNLLWKKQAIPVSGTGITMLVCKNISIDPNGAIWVLTYGSSYMQVKIDTASFLETGYRMFKFASDGTLLNHFSVPGSNGSIYSMTVDSKQNPVLIGKFTGVANQSYNNIDFGNGILITHTSLTTSQYDIFIVKYNPSGVAQWASFMNAAYQNNATTPVTITGVYTDNNNSAWVAGYYNNKAYFYTDTLSRYAPDGYARRPFLLKYNSSGNYLGYRTTVMNDSTRDDFSISTISFDSDNEMYMFGIYGSKGFLFADSLFPSAGSSTTDDRVVLRMDTGFVCKWWKYLQKAEDNNAGVNLKIINNDEMIITSHTDGTNIKVGELDPTNYFLFKEDSIATGKTSGTPYIVNFSKKSMATSLLHQIDLFSMKEIFPNPATNRISLRNFSNTTSTVVIYDINSRVLMNQKELKNTESIDISGLKKGMYFLRVSSGKKVETAKFIIQ